MSRYCGLSPCNRSSGKRQADAGLIRHANHELRTVILETAHRLARYDAKWKQLKQHLIQRGKSGSVATAAVANRWLRWLYHQIVTNSTDQAVSPDLDSRRSLSGECVMFSGDVERNPLTRHARADAEPLSDDALTEPRPSRSPEDWATSSFRQVESPHGLGPANARIEDWFSETTPQQHPHTPLTSNKLS